MLQHELETAIELARQAGVLILKHYETDFEAEYKIGVDNCSEPVTIADREASRLIVEGLAAAFPGDAILSEEEADDVEPRLAASRVWIIDPIDGTAGFIKRDGDFSVQIGLAEGGVPVAGVVYQPFHNVLTYAMKGGGAWKVAGDAPLLMRTSNAKSPTDLKLAVSRNHPSERMSRIIEHLGFNQITQRGSVGLKVGLIADQTCDVYITPSRRTKLWDTCGPQIILEEAGGRFTDIFGSDLRYDLGDVQNHNGIVATNGVSHDTMIDSLKPLLQEFGRIPYAVAGV